MADAQASGACGSNIVWVQVPSPAREKQKEYASFYLHILFCFWSRACLEPRVQGLRSAPVGAEQMSTGHLAPHLLQGGFSFACRRIPALGFKISPSARSVRSLWSAGAEPMSTGHLALHLLREGFCWVCRRSDRFSGGCGAEWLTHLVN